MSEKPKDPVLYAQAMDYADAIYDRPSAYKSMAIQKQYMKLYREKYGDRDAYTGPKRERDLEKWRREKWTDVESFLEGNPRPCGEPPKPGERKRLPACRPIKELEKIPPDAARRAVALKARGETIDWDKLVSHYSRRKPPASKGLKEAGTMPSWASVVAKYNKDRNR